MCIAVAAAAAILLSAPAAAQPSLSVLHVFAGETEPQHPNGLLAASDGAFYGTSSDGGAFHRGSIFRLAADGSVAVLHSFSGPDGAAPRAALIQGSDGDFYGTTV